jgi:hypothetical protein
MLIRTGNIEADLKIAAVMSTPRLAFSDNMFCVSQALAPHGISPYRVTGAFWGQCLERAMQFVMDDNDVILTIDYDSVFSTKTFEALVALFCHSGVDALAPLQTKREANTIMLSLPGVGPEEKKDVDDAWFKKSVQLVDTAHFGLTLIRVSALKKLPKPWFLAAAGADGTWEAPDHVDEDIFFWNQWKAAGNTLGIATAVSIGHIEPMITWPSRETGTGKVQQHTTEYWKGGAGPKEAWGIVR